MPHYILCITVKLINGNVIKMPTLRQLQIFLSNVRTTSNKTYVGWTSQQKYPVCIRYQSAILVDILHSNRRHSKNIMSWKGQLYHNIELHILYCIYRCIYYLLQLLVLSLWSVWKNITHRLVWTKKYVNTICYIWTKYAGNRLVFDNKHIHILMCLTKMIEPVFSDIRFQI